MGKLLVLEGTDGAGKTTQTQILLDNLRAKGLKVDTIDFPGYSRTRSGGIIKRYLQGEFGDVNGTSPYVIAPLYALDRFESQRDLRKKLVENDVVIATRYVISNTAYMAAKLPVTEREKFRKWLNKLEYKSLLNYKEDLVIFLSLPPNLSNHLIQKRQAGLTPEKNIHEEDLEYMQNVWHEYIEYCGANENCFKIDCFRDDEILPINTIATRVQKIALKNLI